MVEIGTVIGASGFVFISVLIHFSQEVRIKAAKTNIPNILIFIFFIPVCFLYLQYIFSNARVRMPG
jgi:hypothetical protein